MAVKGLSRRALTACAAGLLLGGTIAVPVTGATPAGVTGHVIVAFQRGAAAGGAAWDAVAARYGLSRPRAVFRGHEDWAIEDFSATSPAFDGARAAAELSSLPQVRWAEPDIVMSSAGTGSTGSTGATSPTGAAAGSGAATAAATTASTAPALQAPTLPVSLTPAKSAPPARPVARPKAANPATITPTRGRTATVGPVAPPTTCTGTGGLNAGKPNDPWYCTEGNTVPGPYYSEEWNAFCFTPLDQLPSITAAAAVAPNTPAASGMCADGAWANGYQGQGTIIAVLDSGVDYYHPDLVNQMVDESSDPLLLDPRYPGRASDGHVHGWNFYDDNADPMDFYGHGTGRAGIAAAQADNGIGVAGISPRSKIMAVKVGDTYVVHSEVLAQGAVYAADHGADSINTSLGSVGASKLLAEAALYAYGKGVTWAAATANEYSDHHNYPNTDSTVWGMGGLGPDLGLQSVQTCQSGNTQCLPAQPQTTFLQKVNYSNFGGGMTFATPIDTPSTVAAAEACHKDPLVAPPAGCKGQGSYSLHNSGTSTATPHGAAAGALVRSAGLENGYCQGHLTLGYVFPACTDTPLTSNEVRQILAYTATRVHNNDAPTSNNYPPSNGVSFNDGPFYPAVNGDPHTGWNQWYGYGRPNLYDAVLYAAAKQIPPEAQLFGQTVPETAAFSGLSGPQWFGYYDPTRTPSLPIVGHVGDARHVGAGHTWSFKVQVAPCLEPADADWQTIATHAGLTVPSIDGVLATWTLPATPGQCADTSASRAFDYPGTYTVRVLASDDGVGGSAPNVTDPAGINAPAPLVGQDRRVLFVLHAASSHPGFPLSLGTSGEGSPTLYDLEGRGELDLIIPSADGEIIALRPDGTPVPGWPVFAAPLAVPGVTAVDGQAPRSQFVASVAVTDLNGDGRPDVVAALLKGGVYAWRNDGSLLPGFPVGVPPPSNGPPASASDYCGTTHAYGYATRYADYGTIAAPVLGDLEGTGRKDIVIAAGNGCVYALRPDGTPLPGWPVHPNAAAKEPYKIAATPALGSLSGDGRLDVIVGTEEVSGSVPNTNGYLYAYGPDGKLLPGWPVTPTSLSAAGVPTVASGIISSPALADPAGDGKLRLAGGVFLGGTDQQHPVNTYNPDGSTYSTLQTYLKGLGSNETDPSGAFGFGVTQTAVGRLGGATSLSVVSGGLSPLLVADTAAAPGKKPQFDHLVGAWDMTSGSAVATFPRMIEDWQFLSGPVIADVKGDGTRQVIAGSGGYWVHAFDPTVTADPTINSTTNNVSTTLQRYADYPEPAGFPVFTGGYITTTPAVGQLTRGGPVSLVTMTRDGFLVVTDTKGQPAANDQWWHFHHDERNTGRYGLDTRPPATVNDLAIAGVADPATSTDDSGRSLTWTAPGNDWWVGQADHYDLRWSTFPLTYASFASGTPIATAKPKAGGQTESLTLSGLPTGRVYFALRTFDAAGNASQTAFFVTGASQPPSTGPLPNTALGAGGPLLLALLLPLTALALWRRARVAGAP